MLRVSCMTYNQVSYIEDAMNGFVMQQTDFPFVCTIVDDASNDGEQNVIKKYIQEHFDLQDSFVAYEKDVDYGHVTFAQHKSNKNCYFAVIYLKENHYSQKKSKLPYLTEWMDTKYIALCEGDDYWTDPLKLQKQVDILEEHQDCSFCGTGFVVYKNGEKDVDMTIYSSGSECVFYGKESFGRLWIVKTLTLLIRGECYIAYINTEKTKYLYPKDVHLQYHLFKCGKGAYIPQPMGVYNNDGQGVWNSKPYSEKVVSQTNTLRELYYKNDKDADIYDLYMNSLRETIETQGVKGNKVKLWIEGLKESVCNKDRKRVTRSFLYYLKHRQKRFAMKSI